GFGKVNTHHAVLMTQQMNAPDLDLMVKDGLDDIGLEPNTITPYMWASPDIWIRNNPDNLPDHQNPEYSPSEPNYIYVKVTNKSCQTSTSNETLNVYWAKAGTSLAWPDTWMGTAQFPNTALMGAPVQLHVPIPVLGPGETTIVQVPFMVPDPANYSFAGNDAWHFCLLARVESALDPPVETDALYANVMNNNNIAWKNITVIDVEPNSVTDDFSGTIAVGNPFDEPRTFFLELIKEETEGGKPIYEEAEIGIKMDEVLFNAWERGGKQGANLGDTPNNRIKMVKGNNVIVDKIAFNPRETGTMNLNFHFLVNEMTDKSRYVYHVIQREQGTNKIIGGETYVIKKKPRPSFQANAGGDKIVDQNAIITISAQQIGEAALYNWYDSQGNLVYEGKDLTVAANVVSEYKLEVIALSDGFKDYTNVQISFNPAKIETISPNPSTHDVDVTYKLNGANSAYLMVMGTFQNTTSNNYILDVNSTSMNIDISNYPNGFYTVALVCNGSIVDAKTLVKQ
ncbi:MAG TPA: hypothetical protein VK476_04340, partial [Flavobacterium sp.]|nr:hypothetical protein [Flavobacterium sp.]